MSPEASFDAQFAARRRFAKEAGRDIGWEGVLSTFPVLAQPQWVSAVKLFRSLTCTYVNSVGVTRNAADFKQGADRGTRFAEERRNQT